MFKGLGLILCDVPVVHAGPNSTITFMHILFFSWVYWWVDLVTMGGTGPQVSEQEFSSLQKAEEASAV